MERREVAWVEAIVAGHCRMPPTTRPEEVVIGLSSNSESLVSHAEKSDQSPRNAGAMVSSSSHNPHHSRNKEEAAKVVVDVVAAALKVLVSSSCQETVDHQRRVVYNELVASQALTSLGRHRT